MNLRGESSEDLSYPRAAKSTRITEMEKTLGSKYVLHELV